MTNTPKPDKPAERCPNGEVHECGNDGQHSTCSCVKCGALYPNRHDSAPKAPALSEIVVELSCESASMSTSLARQVDEVVAISGCTEPNDVRAGAAVAGRPEKAATAGPGSQNSEGRDDTPSAVLATAVARNRELQHNLDVACESIKVGLSEKEKLQAEVRELREALEEAHMENVGLTAYLETCSPEVIVENLPTLVASLQRKRELIEGVLARVKE